MRILPRGLDGFLEFLGSVGGLEGRNDIAKQIAHQHAVVGRVEADTVVGHAILGAIVGTDLLGAITRADLRQALSA